MPRMTREEREALMDDLFGAPDNRQVALARKLVESCPYTTTALSAIVAALRQMEADDQARALEGFVSDMAEVEIEEL